MTELATYHPTETVAQGVPVDAGKVLAYLGLNPEDPRSQAVVAVAQRYDLDPLLKHVIIIPKGGVYITRDGLLHVAHRSGQLDGIVVEQEPTFDAESREWVSRVSVYRKDMRHPFTFPGRYPASGTNKDYAQEMALKAAEAHALRRAFDVTGLPIVEERQPDTPHTGGLASALAAQDETPQVETGELITEAQMKKLHASFNDLGITDRQERLDYSAAIIGRQIASSKDLSKDEARRIIDKLDEALAGTGNPDPAEAVDPTVEPAWGEAQ